MRYDEKAGHRLITDDFESQVRELQSVVLHTIQAGPYSIRYNSAKVFHNCTVLTIALLIGNFLLRILSKDCCSISSRL